MSNFHLKFRRVFKHPKYPRLRRLVTALIFPSSLCLTVLSSVVVIHKRHWYDFVHLFTTSFYNTLHTLHSTYPYSVCVFCFFLARSANLPEGLYILPMFFLYFFFIFFLMVDFLANVAETLIEQSSPKFQDS